MFANPLKSYIFLKIWNIREHRRPGPHLDPRGRRRRGGARRPSVGQDQTPRLPGGEDRRGGGRRGGRGFWHDQPHLPGRPLRCRLALVARGDPGAGGPLRAFPARSLGQPLPPPVFGGRGPGVGADLRVRVRSEISGRSSAGPSFLIKERGFLFMEHSRAL
jgi:hypothetical protein